MPLKAFMNTFAGNPLNRASERRGDEAWLAEKLDSPDSLAVAIWNGRPLVEKAEDGGLQLAYIPARMADKMTGGMERLLFMGLWKETAVWAVDLEGGTDP
ncbi:MAG: NUDIX-like domain-containing protein, partial [Phenylobacterium sp.]|nr:NUDIX-like domain-containing protein [Phenylobacterium sp.]